MDRVLGRPQQKHKAPQTAIAALKKVRETGSARTFHAGVEIQSKGGGFQFAAAAFNCPIKSSGKFHHVEEFTNYQHSSLLRCSLKIFERLLLKRLLPPVAPQMEETQAGFRWRAAEKTLRGTQTNLLCVCGCP